MAMPLAWSFDECDGSPSGNSSRNAGVRGELSDPLARDYG